jgi:hypothetical protein
MVMVVLLKLCERSPLRLLVLAQMIAAAEALQILLDAPLGRLGRGQVELDLHHPPALDHDLEPLARACTLWKR